MATRDPLKEFRRGGQPQQNPHAPSPQPAQTARPPAPIEDEELEPVPKFDPRTGREIYQAFRVITRRVDHLEIRQAISAWQFPRYFDMSDMTTNQRLGTEIVLQFPLYAVFIEGRNLQPLVYSLKHHRCDFIQEYHPEKFAPLIEDEQAPFIKSIRLQLKIRKSAENQQEENQSA